MLRMLTKKKKSVSELLPEQKELEVAKDVIALEILKQKDANVTKIILNVIAGVIIRGHVAIKIKNYIP